MHICPLFVTTLLSSDSCFYLFLEYYRIHMSLSTISRSARQLYSKYHHVESLSFYLSSSFTRHLRFALRLLITCLLGGFLAYATTLDSRLTQVYMIPNIGILTLQETFGCTLSKGLQIICTIAPVSIFLFIIQQLGLSYHNYVVGEFLMCITSFYISYQCRKVTVF